MSIWFTSDLHIGHKNIAALAGRTLEGQELDEHLIETWNDTVAKSDEIWVLGDIFWRASDTGNFDRLNGRKHLVVGNHDSATTIALAWQSVNDLVNFKRDGFRAVLCHYPLLTWNGAHRGTVMLHGHSHGNVDGLNERTTRLDVGVDTAARLLGAYRPFELSEIREILSRRTYEAIDHHE